MSVKVPQKVYDAIEAVRRSGLTNMLDRNAVQVLCDRMGFYEAVIWIEDNKQEYSKAIFEGFEIISEVKDGIPKKI